MRLLFFIFIFLYSLTVAESLQIDFKQSTIEFYITHIGRMNVKGSFSQFDINLNITDQNWSSANVIATIDVKSLTTKNRIRDKHLKSEEFFNRNQFPIITESFFYKDENLWVKGDLTIKNITQKVDLPITIDQKTPHQLKVESITTLNRFDFGMSSHKRTIKKEFIAKINIMLKQSQPIIPSSKK